MRWCISTILETRGPTWSPRIGRGGALGCRQLAKALTLTRSLSAAPTSRWPTADQPRRQAVSARSASSALAGLFTAAIASSRVLPRPAIVPSTQPRAPASPRSSTYPASSERRRSRPGSTGRSRRSCRPPWSAARRRSDAPRSTSESRGCHPPALVHGLLQGAPSLSDSDRALDRAILPDGVAGVPNTGAPGACRGAGRGLRHP